jgi:hypothetical protein
MTTSGRAADKYAAYVVLYRASCAVVAGFVGGAAALLWLFVEAPLALVSGVLVVASLAAYRVYLNWGNR